jgi:gluconate 2-dehydrogenase subunit 3-like protein/AMP-activated protein kinase-like protein
MPATVPVPAVEKFSVTIVERDDQYILNQCAKHLARENTDERHNFGQFPAGDPRGRICESYHFPIIDSFFDGQDQERSYGFNEVTFVYCNPFAPAPQEVAVVGTFAKLYERVPLRPVKFNEEETGYYAVTCVIPKGEVHRYKYLVDGELKLDPINPQRSTLDNGEIWSRFFTHLCTAPLALERYEMRLLDRLVDHILPFRTEEGERFLRFFYNSLDKLSKEGQFAHAYRLDQSVGAVNFISNLLAREESHHLIDYQICLGEIDRVLRQRNPFTDPGDMSKEMFIQLYNEMAADNAPGWDYSKYSSPRYFLMLLRRHTFTGAFAHPKHGGNVGGVGWAYLAERFADPQTGETLFNWRRAIEKPLGANEDYRG